MTRRLLGGALLAVLVICHSNKGGHIYLVTDRTTVVSTRGDVAVRAGMMRYHRARLGQVLKPGAVLRIGPASEALLTLDHDRNLQVGDRNRLIVTDSEPTALVGLRRLFDETWATVGMTMVAPTKFEVPGSQADA